MRCGELGFARWPPPRAPLKVEVPKGVPPVPLPQRLPPEPLPLPLAVKLQQRECPLVEQAGLPLQLFVQRASKG